MALVLRYLLSSYTQNSNPREDKTKEEQTHLG